MSNQRSNPQLRNGKAYKYGSFDDNVMYFPCQLQRAELGKILNNAGNFQENVENWGNFADKPVGLLFVGKWHHIFIHQSFD